MPKFSIIVPVYNAEKYIRRCVDSVLMQTFTDYELILVDDGSPDGSGAICDEYAEKDARIKVIHKENGGVSSARNKGLDIASGERIMFVDSDDWIDARTLEALNSIFQEKDTDILCFGFFSYTENGLIPYVIDSMDCSVGDMVVSLPKIRGNVSILCTVWNKVYKREIIEAYQIRFASIPFGEDSIFDLRYYLYAKSVRVIEDCFYFYDVTNEASAVKRVYINYYEFVEKISNALYDLADKYARGVEQISKYCADFVRDKWVYGINNCLMSDKSSFEKADVINEWMRKTNTNLKLLCGINEVVDCVVGEYLKNCIISPEFIESFLEKKEKKGLLSKIKKVIRKILR